MLSFLVYALEFTKIYIRFPKHKKILDGGGAFDIMNIERRRKSGKRKKQL